MELGARLPPLADGVLSCSATANVLRHTTDEAARKRECNPLRLQLGSACKLASGGGVADGAATARLQAALVDVLALPCAPAPA